MTLNLGGWIHSFTVTDTQTHKGGYTIYKITSIIFPQSVPQALTCLVVWKRYHDVKRLHRELSRRHKTLQLPGCMPVPSDNSYFKRFDADVIQRRKTYILELLDFAAQHPSLYKCSAFAQFFNDSYEQSPNASPIHKLHVEKRNNSKNQLTNIANECIGNKNQIENVCTNLKCNEGTEVAPCNESFSNDCQAHNCVDDIDGADIDRIQNEDIIEKSSSGRDYMRYLTPMASIDSDDGDYIYDAALEFSHAVQAEVNLNYKTAYERYKHGVELLLNGVKDDDNDKRKFIAKAKIAKYLARAEEIEARFFNNLDETHKSSKFQVCIENVNEYMRLERPWNQLAKFKVRQIIGSHVMQVQCITEQQQNFYVMKGIEKPSSNSQTRSIFLPQNVPFMVDLLAFFQSEQKIFLLLNQAEGGLLYDYIQNYKVKTNFSKLKDDKAESGYNDTKEMENDIDTLIRNSQQLIKSVTHTLLEVKLKEQQIISPSKKHFTKSQLPEVCLKKWACELAIAIHSLHEKGLILRDLYMSNLMVGAKGQLLLTYFYQNEGLISSDNFVHKALNTVALSGHFVAPERPLTRKSDWWSYGVVLYELLVGMPFKSAHPGYIELYGSVQYPDNIVISEMARNLIENLIQKTPDSRLDYKQIQMHSYFHGINWQSLYQEK